VDHLEPITLYENTVRGMEARKHLPSTEYRPQFIVPALWKEAKAIAKQRGENLSDIIRAALQAYIDKHQGEK
jgi:hypothetical protein